MGLIIDAGDPVTGSSLSIASDEGGWSGQIYAAAGGPPTTLQGWGQPVGEISNAGDDQAVELNVAEPSRVLPDLDHRARRSPRRLQGRSSTRSP